MTNKSTCRVIIGLIMIILGFWPNTSYAKKNKNRLKVGLVLGGGGAKGAAEVGVLKFIEKSGVPIDYIAGTSIGSIIGGLYSCGYRSADLDSMFSSQQWKTLLTDRNMDYDRNILTKKDGITYLFGYPVGRKANKESGQKFGIVHGDSISSLLSNMAISDDSIDFDSLPIPFRCVAVDINTLKEVVLDCGQLSKAMRASMSIPGVFKPVPKDSMLLVDGGVLNNLPVDVVRSMGADIVIAIDLTQNKRETKNKTMKAKKGLRFLIDWNRTRPDLKKYNVNRNNCDVYINPNLKGFDAADFKSEKIQEMIIAGEKAGKAALPELKRIKKKIYE